jgi:hypothetical protein
MDHILFLFVRTPTETTFTICSPASIKYWFVIISLHISAEGWNKAAWEHFALSETQLATTTEQWYPGGRYP